MFMRICAPKAKNVNRFKKRNNWTVIPSALHILFFLKKFCHVLCATVLSTNYRKSVNVNLVQSLPVDLLQLQFTTVIIKTSAIVYNRVPCYIGNTTKQFDCLIRTQWHDLSFWDTDMFIDTFILERQTKDFEKDWLLWVIHAKNQLRKL